MAYLRALCPWLPWQPVISGHWYCKGVSPSVIPLRYLSPYWQWHQRGKRSSHWCWGHRLSVCAGPIIVKGITYTIFPICLLFNYLNGHRTDPPEWEMLFSTVFHSLLCIVTSVLAHPYLSRLAGCQSLLHFWVMRTTQSCHKRHNFSPILLNSAPVYLSF